MIQVIRTFFFEGGLLNLKAYPKLKFPAWMDSDSFQIVNFFYDPNITSLHNSGFATYRYFSYF